MMIQFTLAELAELTRAQLVGNPDQRIKGVDALDTASIDDASFLANSRYKEHMKASRAGVICVDKNCDLIPQRNFLISSNPSQTFQIIAEAIMGEQAASTGFTGIHPTAVIHPDACVAPSAQIGPYVVIDRGTTVAAGAKLMAHVSIGAGCDIGEDCILYPHAVVRERCVLGKRVILQPGAIIGSCGFGYITDSSGYHQKLEQLGNVILDDDVEVGANTTIDRARFKTTRIHKGTKIDNLVQVGHNVELGKDNLIVSQTGIAGSTKTGRHVVMGGQVGVVGHVEIGDNVIIASRGGVSKDIKTSGKFNGSPVIPLTDYNRQQVHLRKIATYAQKIKELEERIARLEK